MKKTNTALIALIGFVIFIVILVLIVAASVSKYVQSIDPQIRQITNTANQIANAGGGTINAGANAINNVTATSTVPGTGGTQGSTLANFPTNAAVVEYSPSVVGVVYPPIPPNGYTIIRVTRSGVSLGILLPQSPIGSKFAVINQAASNSFVIVLSSGNYATITGGGVRVDPGFFITFTADSSTNFTANLPSRI